jgi:serine protease
MKNIATTIILFLFSLSLNAQSRAIEDHKKGEYIIQFRSDVDADVSLVELQRTYSDMTVLKTITEFQYYVIKFENLEPAEEQARLSALRNSGIITTASFNFALQQRSGEEPNDTYFADKQWEMKTIGVADLWKYTTGGTTACGDTIVVAILEISGYDMKHEDLVPNIFVNRAEIPNNGKDDDGNGRIDDVTGWNVKAKNGVQITNTHGTIVAGIVGARGDNGKGVTGVNQYVKMLLVSGMVYEDEIIEGYAYILSMRQLYKSSKGKKGAYVVATNTSLGIDFAKPEDHPLWCNIYDNLGKEGILSVAATTNSGNANIDAEGDVPSGCTSPYLITVTNSDKADNKFPGAGFGFKSIDLSAPGGGDFWTTAINSKYAGVGTTGGTSYASPHVAGAVGLLYSIPSSKFCTLLKSDPVAAVTTIKTSILSGVKPIQSMKSQTTTGGRLDMNGAFGVLSKQYGNVKGDLAITNVTPTLIKSTQGTIKVDFITPEFGNYTIFVTDMIGRRVATKEIKSEPFGFSFSNVDLPVLAAGAYVVSLFDNNNKIVSTKIIVYQ